MQIDIGTVVFLTHIPSLAFGQFIQNWLNVLLFEVVGVEPFDRPQIRIDTAKVIKIKNFISA